MRRGDEFGSVAIATAALQNVMKRSRAQKDGVRPLKLHAARHTFATLALESGRSIRFVAEQLGHANPALTLRVYAHAMPAEPGDVGFADFTSVTKRHYASPPDEAGAGSKNAPDASGREHSGKMEHETRFELATLTLASSPRNLATTCLY